MNKNIQINPILGDDNPRVQPRVDTATIFEKSVPGRRGFSLAAESPDTDEAVKAAIPSPVRKLLMQYGCHDHHAPVEKQL